MKKILAAAIATLSLNAHAGDLCSYVDATTFLHQNAMPFSGRFISDGITYRRARPLLKIAGYPVLYVFGFDPRGSRHLFPGAMDGSSPAPTYGVVILADSGDTPPGLSGYNSTVEPSPVCEAGRTCIRVVCNAS